MNLMVPLLVFSLLVVVFFDDLLLMTGVFLIAVVCYVREPEILSTFGMFVFFLLFLFSWIRHVMRLSVKQCLKTRIFISVIAFIVLAGGSTIYLQQMEILSKVRESIADGYQLIRYGDEEKQRITVTVHGNTTYPVYIDKSNYWNLDHGTAISLEEASIDEKYRKMSNYFVKHEFDRMNQLGQYLSLYEIESDKEANEYQMDVAIQSGSRRFLYSPCTAISKTITDLSKISKWGEYATCKGLVGKTEYKISAFDRDVLELLNEDIKWLSQNDKVTNYRECERIYRNFVYDNYLNISKKKQNELKQLNLEHIGGKNLKEVSDSIQFYLHSLDEREHGVDEVELGLYLFRYAGAPCRVACGYILYPENLKHDNKVEFQKEDECFWIELYVNGVGFVPVDLNGEEVQSSIALSSTEKNEEIIENDYPRKSISEKANEFSLIELVKEILFGMIIFLIFCVVLRFLRICIWNLKIHTKDDKEFARLLCIDLENMMKCSKLKIDIHYPHELCLLAKDYYGVQMYEGLLLYFQQLDQVIFNGEGMTSGMRKQLLSIHYDIYHRMIEKNTWIDKLQLWYCRNITKRWETQDEKER